MNARRPESRGGELWAHAAGSRPRRSWGHGRAATVAGRRDRAAPSGGLASVLGAAEQQPHQVRASSPVAAGSGQLPVSAAGERLAGDGVERDRAPSAGERAAPAARRRRFRSGVGMGVLSSSATSASASARWCGGLMYSRPSWPASVGRPDRGRVDHDRVGCGSGCSPAQAPGEPVALAFGHRAERRGEVNVPLADADVQGAQSRPRRSRAPIAAPPRSSAAELSGRVLEDLAQRDLSPRSLVLSTAAALRRVFAIRGRATAVVDGGVGCEREHRGSLRVGCLVSGELAEHVDDVRAGALELLAAQLRALGAAEERPRRGRRSRRAPRSPGGQRQPARAGCRRARRVRSSWRRAGQRTRPSRGTVIPASARSTPAARSACTGPPLADRDADRRGGAWPVAGSGRSPTSCSIG